MIGAKLTIFCLNEVSEVTGLKDELEKLGALSEINIQKNDFPAAFGELAGQAIQILISDPVQAITTAVTLGDIFYSIIKLIKKSGKRLRIDKELAKLLALAKLSEKQSEEKQINNIEDSVVWGPMLIEPLEGFLLKESEDRGYDASGDKSFLIAIALPKEPRTIRTIWQIISVDGTRLTSWATQTLAERVPDFFLRK